MYILTFYSLETTLLQDLECGKAVLAGLLRHKTQIFRALPWVLCGIAHTDHDIGRQCGQRALDLFAEDPREEAQHRITWSLLEPQSDFRSELELFIQGTPLFELAIEFVRQIAVWRFCYIVETTIESRHSNVTQERKKHHIGPVRVSLSNRLPLMERWIRKKQLDMDELTHCFTEARSLHSAASLLDLERHPCLLDMNVRKGRGGKVSAVHPWLTKAIYNCSIESMYRGMADQGKANTSAKRKIAETEAKFIRVKPEPPSFARVEFLSMQDHLL